MHLVLPSQVVIALRQRLRVAHNLFNVLLFSAGKGQQAVLHAKVVLTDHVQL